jgi:RNA polymerase sigma-70 factor (ECF subfamily)
MNTIDSFEDLVRAELATLHRRAFRLTRDHDAAQDLVQDTLERAYRKLARFQPGTNIRAWLMCIMRNIWISDYRRRAGAPSTVPLEEVEETSSHHHGGNPSATSDVEASVVDELSAASIHLAIDGLPSHLRQVVVLADVEETPYGTIATALAIPPGTVASRLFRGRRRLQQVLLDQARGEDRLAKAS